ncbi:MAG: hypothetical protein CMJ32_04425 [Phycisphaerae bacterium]|nr:hypothetical protein [Phycisphaerae bacterium]
MRQAFRREGVLMPVGHHIMAFIGNLRRTLDSCCSYLWLTRGSCDTLMKTFMTDCRLHVTGRLHHSTDEAIES